VRDKCVVAPECKTKATMMGNPDRFRRKKEKQKG